MTEKREYDRVSVDRSLFDNALEIAILPDVRLGGHRQVIRINVADIPAFADAVVRTSMYALTSAAKRLEAGHCETCGNVGVVDEEVRGRTRRVQCPTCSERRNAITPFLNAPTIGRLE